MNAADGAPPSAPTPVRAWRFGSVTFDEARMELAVQGVPVALERKPLEVLRHLLRHAGEVVTRDELQAAVWPGRILSDTVLAKAVSRLREVLNEAGAAAIKTVHGYGYRLIGEVSVAAPQPALRGESAGLGLAAGQPVRRRPGWHLEALLGRGGRSEVWRAREAASGEVRVLKFALDADGLAGIKRELTLHQLFAHALGEAAPSVPVLGANLEEAPFFLELAHVAGGDLGTWLAARGGGVALDLPARVALFADVARCVAQAHAVGVLHKDLKPANVLVAEGPGGVPRPLLADFGSAGVISDEVLRCAGIPQLGFGQHLTTAGATPIYVAPEVLRGRLHTTRSDLYALGVMLYQLLAGDLQRPLAIGWEADIADPLLREDIAACVIGEPELRLAAVAELVQRLDTLPTRRARRAQLEADARAAAAATAEAAALRRQVHAATQRRGWLALVLAVFAVGAATAGTFAVRERSAAARAREAGASTEAAMQFVLDDMLGAVSLEHGPIKQLTINQIVERSARKVEERFPPGDLASRARAYRALHEVYAVTDHRGSDGDFDDWLNGRAIASVAAWLAADPQAAYPLAYQTVSASDFWDADPKLPGLIAATARAAAAAPAGRVRDGERLMLRLLDVRVRLRAGHWRDATTTLAPLLPPLRERLGAMLVEQPPAVPQAIFLATRLGLHEMTAGLCAEVARALALPPLADDAGQQLEGRLACANAAANRADGRLAERMAREGLAMSRANYDEMVGYVPSFLRILSAAMAARGELAQALLLADEAVALRRQRDDLLLAPMLVHRGILREQADQPGPALADYREAEERFSADPIPLMAVEAHARLARLLARRGDLAGARAAEARIPPTASDELPATHVARAALLQSGAWLAADPRQAQAGLAAAEGLLAGIGYPATHYLRQELVADREALALKATDAGGGTLAQHAESDR